MIVFIILVCASGVFGDHYVTPDGSLVLFPSPDQGFQSPSPLLMSPPSSGTSPRAPRIEIPQNSKQDSRPFQVPTFIPYPRQFEPQAFQPLPIFSRPQPSSFQPLPTFSQPQPSSFQPLPTFSQPQPSSFQPLPTFSQPQPSSFQPLPTLSLPQPQTFQPAFSPPQLQPQLSHQPQTLIRPLPHTQQSSICGASGSSIHDSQSGINYHFSWCVNSDTYTWDQANSYCSSLGRGFKVVSIQNKDKDDFVTRIIARHPVQFIWTSGNKRGSSTWQWSSGYTITYTNWSHTGGNGRPQPDNREGNEDCLGVLNNFYNDGIKWHDIACYHRKPVICETSL